MRFVLFAALLTIAACNPSTPTQHQRVGEGCTYTASHEIAWTNDASPDTVTTTSSGPTCAQAIVTFVIRNAAGDPLWTFSTTYYDMSIGGRGPEEPPPVSDADTEAFLARWARVEINHSSDLPAWPANADSLGAAVDGMAYHTEFDRETYEALRARTLPQACFAAATEATQCLVIDPMTNAPSVIVAFGI